MRPLRSRVLRLAGGALFALMLGLTACGLDTPLNRFAFTRTSGEYLMTIVSGPAVGQGVLLFGAGYGLWRAARRPTVGWAALLGAVALCWGLSGRKVGVLPDEGRVYIGWFGVQTAQFALCSPAEDCELTLLRTRVTALPCWRVRLANAHTQRTFFVGPVTWVPTLRMLRQACGPPANE